MNGYWIVLSNIAGVLDRQFVASDSRFSDETLASAAIKFISDIGVLNDGDKITIEQGTEEGIPEKW